MSLLDYTYDCITTERDYHRASFPWLQVITGNKKTAALRKFKFS